jgi:hypothetical protein
MACSLGTACRGKGAGCTGCTPNLKELSSFPLFHRKVLARLRAGAREYGNASFSFDPLTLLSEVKEELLDVCGWSYILFSRMERMERELSSADLTLEGDEDDG